MQHAESRGDIFEIICEMWDRLELVASNTDGPASGVLMVIDSEDGARAIADEVVSQITETAPDVAFGVLRCGNRVAVGVEKE